MNAKISTQEILDYLDSYSLKISNNLEKSNTFNLVKEIEEKFPVDEIRSKDDVRMWNIIRIFLAYELPKSLNVSQKKYSTEKLIKKYVNIISEGVTPLQSFKEEDLFFAFSSGESRKKVNGDFFDIYFDPLYQLFNEELVVCEWPEISGTRRDYKKNVFSKKFIKMHIPLFSRTFFELVSKQFTTDFILKNESEKMLDEIIEFVEQESSFDFSFIKKQLFSYLSTFYILKKFFVHFLNVNKPKAIFIRCGYGRFPMALAQAAKELGITSIEFQHGLFTSYSIAYVKNYNSDNDDCTPDYLFTYGNVFSHIAQKGSVFKKEFIHSIGFPYLDLKIDRRDYDKCFNFKKDGEITVLFSSQWTIDKKIEGFFLKVGTALDEGKSNIHIMFNPHPFSQRPDQFIGNINEIRNDYKKITEQTSKIGEEFFKKNSLKNIERTLEKINLSQV